MATIIGSGRNAEVHLSSKEYEGFEILSTNRALGVPPKQTQQELIAIGLSNHEIIEVSKAQRLAQEGANVYGSSSGKVGHKLNSY